MLATSVVHPLDLIKVRLQLFKEYTTVGMAREILMQDGLAAVYSGLSAGLLRQATYTTTRLGVYNWMSDSYLAKHGVNPPLLTKVGIGVCSGVAGAFVGTPSEVVLVRMMADGPFYPCYCRRQYRSLVDAICKITKEEGFTSLWRGGMPTIVRSIFVSTAQLGTYAQARETFLSWEMKDNVLLHIYTSLIASLATALLSLPADNIKTRSQFVGEKRGQVSIFMSIVRNEGATALWRGFSPYYTRLALHTVFTFTFLEQMNAFYIKFYKENPPK